MNDVLVGVQVHAQPDGLGRTLASLHVGGGPSFRLVLLPDGPDPATRAALSRIDLPKDGTEEALGSPACFNRLARRDWADVIVLVESGCIVGPGWLEALLAALRSRPSVGLAGPSTNLAWNQQAAFQGRAGTRERVIATAEEARRRFGSRARSLAPLYGLGDFCMAVARPVLDAVGAVDEGFGLGPCWEMEYCARALRAGFEAVWACGAYVHRAEFTPRRARLERELFEASKRRYQDAVCGLRLSGARDGYATHCRGNVCAQFAPAGRMRIRRPLRPAAPARTGEPPLASCIMPTRNRADYVLHALELLERQDHRHWELIIVDDGRDRLGDRLPSSERVGYVRVPAGESIGAKRNRACALARGEVIVHWDDDAGTRRRGYAARSNRCWLARPTSPRSGPGRSSTSNAGRTGARAPSFTGGCSCTTCTAARWPTGGPSWRRRGSRTRRWPRTLPSCTLRCGAGRGCAGCRNTICSCTCAMAAARGGSRAGASSTSAAGSGWGNPSCPPATGSSSRIGPPRRGTDRCRSSAA